MSFHFATPTIPFGLSLSFDRLRMIGNTNRLNTTPSPVRAEPVEALRHVDRLSEIGLSGVFEARTNFTR